MEAYWGRNQVLLKDFARHVHEVSRRLKEAWSARAEKLGRTVKYLASSAVDQGEDGARYRRRAEDHGGVGVRADLRRALPAFREWASDIAFQEAKSGRQVITALLAACKATLSQLSKVA